MTGRTRSPSPPRVAGSPGSSDAAVVFLDGEFVPRQQAVVSVFDRSFCYGDGLFETVRLYGGQPFRWSQHLDRLQHGARVLGIHLPFQPAHMHGLLTQLVQRNAMPEAVVRIQLSRGIGPRGYSPKGAYHPLLVMTMHAPARPSPTSARKFGPVKSRRLPTTAPACWQLITSSVRCPIGDPLAALKTCAKLHQVVARAEADAKAADDALLLTTSGAVAETTSANLFWMREETLFTALANGAILPGITRALVFELCRHLGLGVREVEVAPAELLAADAAFLTSSTFGIVEVRSIDGQRLRGSAWLGQLHGALQNAIERECPPPARQPVG